MTAFRIGLRESRDADPAMISRYATDRRAVQLSIESFASESHDELRARIARALPDHMVFGRDDFLTIKPVITRACIAENRAMLEEAIATYRAACVRLIREHRAGTLDPAWRSFRHGLHRAFRHASTGQVVEAPLDSDNDPANVDLDGSFFATYVATTRELAPVAALVRDYHDGERLVDVLYPNRW